MKAAKATVIGIAGFLALGLIIQYCQIALILGAAISILWLMRRYGQPSSRTASTAAQPQPTPSSSIIVKEWTDEDDADLLEEDEWDELDVVGESHTNPDGSNRQVIIAGCKAGDRVRLVRERKNKYDRNAVAVKVKTGQIGYLSSGEAEDVAPMLDDGDKYQARIKKILGGTPDKPSRGVVIEVKWD